MNYVLGVDQGHTETRAAVADMEGNILGVGKTYGACHSLHGLDQAMGAVQEASQMALSQAGVSLRQLALMFCGLTGADWPDEYHLLETNVLSLGLCRDVYIKNDSIVALRGGTSASYGAIVIGGTGGNCAIRSPQGEEFIFHYYHDRDLQGGLGLGWRSLRAIYRAETGREPDTLLKPRVLAMMGLATVDDLLRADVEQRLSLDDVKHIAPLVFQAAYEGDRVACEIIRAFGEGLAELVIAGLRRFDMTRLDVEVVLSGSIFKATGNLVQEVMIAGIHLAAPNARLVNARYEPVVGAVLLGLEASGVQVDERVKRNIEGSSQALCLIRLPDQSS